MEEQRHQESMEFARWPCAPELWPVGKFEELFCEKIKKRWVLFCGTSLPRAPWRHVGGSEAVRFQEREQPKVGGDGLTSSKGLMPFRVSKRLGHHVLFVRGG